MKERALSYPKDSLKALADLATAIINGDECPACGGEGFQDDGSCSCGDDTCCCLEPEPEECRACGGTGIREQKQTSTPNESMREGDVGIDVEIYVECEGEPSDAWLPYDFCVREAGEYEREQGMTHEVWTSGIRYYGKHYERGPWPIICGVLMSLFASPNVKRVWYFGDNRDIDGIEPITQDDLIDLSRHYMQHGERPYRDPDYERSMFNK